MGNKIVKGGRTRRRSVRLDPDIDALRELGFSIPEGATELEFELLLPENLLRVVPEGLTSLQMIQYLIDSGYDVPIPEAPPFHTSNRVQPSIVQDFSTMSYVGFEGDYSSIFSRGQTIYVSSQDSGEAELTIQIFDTDNVILFNNGLTYIAVDSGDALVATTSYFWI